MEEFFALARWRDAASNERGFPSKIIYLQNSLALMLSLVGVFFRLPLDGRFRCLFDQKLTFYFINIQFDTHFISVFDK